MPATLRNWIPRPVDTGPFRFGENPAGDYPPDRTPLSPWLAEHFPVAVSQPMAPRHEALWEWFESLEQGVKPRHRVESWPRGGGKSSTAGLGVVRVGMKQTRRFVLYVSGTQKQANKHVQGIRARFETLGIPRSVGAYGNSLGWSMDLLRVANGFNVLALGLDAAGRGVKLDDVRPDLIVFDDIDERHDSEDTTQKKIETLTESVLPAGSTDAAVLVAQNRIHAGSIVSQLVDGTADFLLRRTAVEEPAIRGLEYESYFDEEGQRLYRITGGEPTWKGQGLQTCEAQLNEWGRPAFLREAQHETEESDDGLWDRKRDIDPFRVNPGEVPALHRIAVAVDPNASSGGDEAGIVAAGVGRVGFRDSKVLHGYLLEDATVGGGPKAWAAAAVECYKRWKADVLVAESNNGGDMVAITIGTVDGAPPVRLIHASRGKQTRAEPVQKLYEDGRVHHVGVFVALEKELCGWRPGDPSPNRLDACFVAGTRVITARGNVPIERLTTRDFAWTRAGWKRVLHCGMTSPEADVFTVHLSDDRTLTGTGNHPIWVEGKGWAALDSLVWGDRLLSWTRNESRSNFREPLTHVPRPAHGDPHACISARHAAVDEICSTGKFGKRTMGRSRPVRTSITGTETHSTTSPPIWSALPLATMPAGIRESMRRLDARGLSASARWLPSGTAPRWVESGTGSTESARGPAESRMPSPASIVGSGRGGSTPARMGPGSVVARALALLLTESADINKRPLAPSAGHYSGRASTERSRPHAPVSVLGLSASGVAPVYNLEVADQPEYFANGVLVHNCVWAFTELMLGSDFDPDAFSPIKMKR